MSPDPNPVRTLPTWVPGSGATQWWRVFLAHLLQRPTRRDLIPVAAGVVGAVLIGRFG